MEEVRIDGGAPHKNQQRYCKKKIFEEREQKGELHWFGHFTKYLVGKGCSPWEKSLPAKTIGDEVLLNAGRA